MLDDFQNARELFEAARSAAIERDHAAKQLERMRHRTLGGSSSISGGGRGATKDVNGTAASIAIVDYESMMRLASLRTPSSLTSVRLSFTAGTDEKVFLRYLVANTPMCCSGAI